MSFGVKAAGATAAPAAQTKAAVGMSFGAAKAGGVKAGAAGGGGGAGATPAATAAGGGGAKTGGFNFANKGAAGGGGGGAVGGTNTVAGGIPSAVGGAAAKVGFSAKAGATGAAGGTTTTALAKTDPSKLGVGKDKIRAQDANAYMRNKTVEVRELFCYRSNPDPATLQDNDTKHFAPP